jgi:hypothetical protein
VPLRAIRPFQGAQSFLFVTIRRVIDLLIEFSVQTPVFVLQFFNYSQELLLLSVGGVGDVFALEDLFLEDSDLCLFVGGLLVEFVVFKFQFIIFLSQLISKFAVFVLEMSVFSP